jgi:hypothetical protein
MWHTPSAQEPGVKPERLICKNGSPAKLGQRAYDKETGRLAQVGLTQQVMWPTPSICGNYNQKGSSKTSGDGLATKIKKWPTPNARDCTRDISPKKDRLSDIVNSNKQTERLNPNWVELLMGWPIGWSALEPIKNYKKLLMNWDNNWEKNIPRVTHKTKNRANRLKVLGNGWVPQCIIAILRVNNAK